MDATHSLSDLDNDQDLSGRQNISFDSFYEDHKKGTTLTSDLFQAYKQKVLDHREGVAMALSRHGTKSIYNYTKEFLHENRNKVVKERRPQVIDVISAQTKRILGSAIAESVGRQLKNNSSTSTAPHYNPFGHPFGINPILQNALPYFGAANNPALQNVLILACANISCNNWAYPLGHLLHTFAKGAVEIQQLRFFGHTSDAKPVLYHPNYAPQAVVDIKNKLIILKRDGHLTQEQLDTLVALFEDTYGSPHALSYDTYTDQLSVANYWLFKKIFARYKKFVPNLVYIPQETVVLELLKNYHMTKDSTLHTLMFDPKAEELMYKYIEGDEGTFDRNTGYGTYLFWARPKEGKYRKQMRKKGNFLETKDGSFKLELTPEAVTAAIENQEVIPSVFLIYVTLGFYYGLTLGGGPAQTKVLPRLKERYNNILTELKDTESLEAARDILTDFMMIPRTSLAFIETPQGRMPATGLDLYLYGKEGALAEFIESTKTTTLDEVNNRALSYYYKEFVPQNEKEERFANITAHDIEEFRGIPQKIPALAEIKSHEQ